METIKLPEAELDEMKQFYQDEYDRTARRLDHIKNILGRLGVDPNGLTAAAGSSGQKSSATPARTKRKSGRKSKWELLVMKRMRQLDKPVTYDELTDEIMTFSKFPEEKRTSTKQAVVNVIFRLRNRDQKLDTFSIGTREKYIALRNWFDDNGKIKKEYLDKIDLPESVARKKAGKRGRRRKKTNS